MIVPVVFKQFHINNSTYNLKDEPCQLVSEFCKSFKLPEGNRNYSVFDENIAKRIASYKDTAIKPVTDMLSQTKNEKEIVAGLLLLNRIIDAGAKNVGSSYHILSRFNYNESANVQTMLAGIYRKTQVPDGFGPLMTMFIKNVQNPPSVNFDPNEEIGGAILEYLRNNAAKENYLK